MRTQVGMVVFCAHLPFPLFISSTEPGEPPCITSAGFQFLLLDTPAQLWYFMLQYLQTAQVRKPGAACRHGLLFPGSTERLLPADLVPDLFSFHFFPSIPPPLSLPIPP